MAKTMQGQRRERLKKAIWLDVYGTTWQYRGTEFGRHARYELRGVSIYVRYTFAPNVFKVFIDGEPCGAEDCVKMFVGADAVTDAVEWTADRLITIADESAKRASPYRAFHEKYLKALRGG